MNIGQKIKQLREARGITLQEIGDLWGISRSSVAGWESGAAKPGIDKLPALARRLGTTVDELLSDRDLPIELAELTGGRSDPALLASIPGARPVRVVEDDSPDLYRIPRVTLRLQAGVTGFQTEPDRRDGGTMGLSRNWVDRKGLDPAKLISIDVRGESMEPTFYEGDTVVINLGDTRPMDNGVFAVNYDGEAVIKRMSRDVGKWWLMSDNADQRRFYRRACQGTECIIIGRVVRREGDHF